MPEMLLGAGTVLTTAQADRAMAAGASFIVAPGFDLSLIHIWHGTEAGQRLRHLVLLGQEQTLLFHLVGVAAHPLAQVTHHKDCLLYTSRCV